jgi:hypothetical protein
VHARTIAHAGASGDRRDKGAFAHHMALATPKRSPKRAAPEPQLELVEPQGAAELRRIASELSGTDELQSVFDEVLDTATRLFDLDRGAVWLWDPTQDPSLELRAQQNVPDELRRMAVASSGQVIDFAAQAFRGGQPVVWRNLSTSKLVPDEFRAVYVRLGIRQMCFIPAIFREQPLGYLMLYHDKPFEWTDEALALARSLGDSIATAIGNARLVESVQSLAARLRAIQDLSSRLSGIQDLRGIGEALVAEARSLVTYDTIRVYRVDHETGWCEPIAFQGVFLGVSNPSPEQLRVQVGHGLTGWVAEHGEALNVRDASEDARRVVVGDDHGPE